MDYLLPHPNTVSRNITKYKAEAKQGLAEEIDTARSEYVSTAFTKNMTIEDYTKVSHLALTCHCITDD